MSDQRLRELERRVAEGDGAAEAPLLAERVRAGTLAPNLLRLAAYLGHPPAREALGDDAPVLHTDPDSLIRGLEAWGPQAWVRAALATTRLASVTLRFLEVWTAIEAWIRDPSLEHLEVCEAKGAAAHDVLAEYVNSVQETDPTVLAITFRESRGAVQAALSATEESRGVTHAVLAGVAARERLSLEGLAPNSPMWIRAAEVGRLGELPELTTKDAVQRVRAAVRDALLPWALAE